MGINVINILKTTHISKIQINESMDYLKEKIEQQKKVNKGGINYAFCCR